MIKLLKSALSIILCFTIFSCATTTVLPTNPDGTPRQLTEQEERLLKEAQQEETYRWQEIGKTVGIVLCVVVIAAAIVAVAAIDAKASGELIDAIMAP
jgi:hypothetical protein